MRQLHSAGWLAQWPLGYFVLDREAVEFFLRSKKVTFPGLKMAEIFGVTEGPLFEEISCNILSLNGENHRRLRNLVNPAFAPRAVERCRPAMRGFLEELTGAFAAGGRCELVEDLCKPYASLTIAAMMGAELSWAARLHDWSNWIQRQFDAADLMEQRDRIEQAVVEFYEFAHDLLERRRHNVGDDLISTLIAARYEGDRLSDTELVNLVLNVLVGGVDTTQSQLAHTVRLLAQHRTNGRSSPTSRSSRRAPLMRRCATSRSPRSPPASCSRRSNTATSPSRRARSSWSPPGTLTTTALRMSSRSVSTSPPSAQPSRSRSAPASTTVSARTSRARRCRRRSPTCRAASGRSNSTASLSSAALTGSTNWSGYRCASASHRLGTSHRSLSENGCRRTRGGWRH